MDMGCGEGKWFAVVPPLSLLISLKRFVMMCVERKCFLGITGIINVKVVRITIEKIRGMLKITLRKATKRKLQPSNQNSNIFDVQYCDCQLHCSDDLIQQRKGFLRVGRKQ